MTRQTWLLPLFMLMTLYASGQQTKQVRRKQVNQDSVYTFVQTPPEFPGGDAALSKYLLKNIRMSKDMLEEGQFSSCVSFVIDTLGCVSNIKPTYTSRSVGTLDRAFMHVVEMMPAWCPGREYGRKVKVLFVLPLQCILPQEE